MAGKDNNGLVISLSTFVLLTVGLGIAWYMTWSHSDMLESQLTTSKSAETKSKEIIQTQSAELSQLKSLIGRGEDTPVADVVTQVKETIAQRTQDGSANALPLEGAMVKVATDGDASRYTAADRMAQLDAKIRENANLTARHEAALAAMKESLDQKEKELADKERTHAEQLGQRENQIDDLKSQLTQEQDAFATYRADRERVIEEREKENFQQRQALIDLRREKYKLEGITFERPDGQLTFVDQNALTCYVDLGKRDELRIGTTFSVYKQNNSGVGRSQSDKDLKGKIEIVGLIGDHLSEARIVDQGLGEPLAPGDAVYSPIFFPGQKIQIAVVGGLEFDGNPGSDRDEFLRIVNGAGAEVVLQVTDDAKMVDAQGMEASVSLITSDTRFLVVGDLGDEDTQDTAQELINRQIRKHHEAMVKAAENSGVYLVSLSSFLDYIGYSRKRLAWTPAGTFPAMLPNGAKSLKVNSSLGSRASSAALSGAYSGGAGGKRMPSASNGSTSRLYRNTNGNE